MRARLPVMLREVDAERMLRIASRHRVIALALRGMGDSAQLLPDALAQSWKEQSFRQAFAALSSASESSRLSRHLQSSGIQCVFLKGSPLAMLAFGDLTLRQAKDIDIFVKEDQIAAAETVLRELGYTRINPPDGCSAEDLEAWRRRAKDSMWMHVGGRIEIELHWSLADSGPDQTPSQADLQMVPLNNNQGLPTLRNDLLLLYLCRHGASHAWSRLKWLTDVHAMLIRSGDDAAAGLFSAASAGRERRSVAQALLLCHLLFSMEMDPTLLRQLRSEPRAKLLVRTALSVMISGRAESEPHETAFASTRIYLSRLLLASNWSELWREAHLSLLPADEQLAARMEGRSTALAPALRLWKWAGKHLSRSLRRT